MIKQAFIATTLLLAISSTGASAQSKRLAKAKDKAADKKEAKVSEETLNQMIAATQKIVFIDSFVVDKEDFLSQYTLSDDAGALYRYEDFFKNQSQANSYVYVNGLGDKCYFSIEDTIGNFALYTSDKFDGRWSPPAKLGGIGDGSLYKSSNFPFMMADGTTFYFAATGDESIGGYDIFVTRYDSESSSFLKAENIGMPFNSTANDYMYAVDEFNNIGWFATDRNQTEGKVCVYTFIPSDTRQLYSPEEYSEEQMRDLASLTRISDTWGDGQARAQALERIKAMRNDAKRRKSADSFAFIINDKTTYTSLTDFKAEGNRERYKKLQELLASRKTLVAALAKARDYYATASDGDKATLKTEILKSEQQAESLDTQIRQIEKEIRNAENKLTK